jgi:hypothetical protein
LHDRVLRGSKKWSSILSPNNAEICYYMRSTDAMQRMTMLTPGTLIHQRYRITRPIGQGGMGAV